MFFFTSHLLWTTLHISILSLSFQMFVGQVGSNENKMGFMFNDIISTFLVQVNYCHHLVSVVCKLFTFQASSPKPLGQLEPNLAGMFLGWSSTKFLFFFPVGYSTWLPGPIICSDRLKFQRSSSLKLMN